MLLLEATGDTAWRNIDAVVRRPGHLTPLAFTSVNDRPSFVPFAPDELKSYFKLCSLRGDDKDENARPEVWPIIWCEESLTRSLAADVIYSKTHILLKYDDLLFGKRPSVGRVFFFYQTTTIASDTKTIYIIMMSGHNPWKKICF